MYFFVFGACIWISILPPFLPHCGAALKRVESSVRSSLATLEEQQQQQLRLKRASEGWLKTNETEPRAEKTRTKTAFSIEFYTIIHKSNANFARNNTESSESALSNEPSTDLVGMRGRGQIGSRHRAPSRPRCCSATLEPLWQAEAKNERTKTSKLALARLLFSFLPSSERGPARFEFPPGRESLIGHSGVRFPVDVRDSRKNPKGKWRDNRR